MSDRRVKASSSPEPPVQRTSRRVSKPLMEKRRRERINNNLEALRLLMVESTGNEKLKNPKVEKAEILESVVQFLKTEKQMARGQQAMRRVMSREPLSACDQQQSYQHGMRSCLLRASRFLASKNQEAKENAGQQAAFTHPESHHGQLMAGPPPPPPPHPPPPGVLAGMPPQHLPHHPYLSGHHCHSGNLLPAPVVPMQVHDAVWRPWPQ